MSIYAALNTERAAASDAAVTGGRGSGDSVLRVKAPFTQELFTTKLSCVKKHLINLLLHACMAQFRKLLRVSPQDPPCLIPGPYGSVLREHLSH